jgi:hypothetical protein
MWWRRRKLERLFDELRAIALLNRLDAVEARSMKKDPYGWGKRQSRQMELLAEIARLDGSHATRQRDTAASTASQPPRPA